MNEPWVNYHEWTINYLASGLNMMISSVTMGYPVEHRNFAPPNHCSTTRHLSLDCTARCVKSMWLRGLVAYWEPWVPSWVKNHYISLRISLFWTCAVMLHQCCWEYHHRFSWCKQYKLGGRVMRLEQSCLLMKIDFCNQTRTHCFFFDLPLYKCVLLCLRPPWTIMSNH